MLYQGIIDWKICTFIPPPNSGAYIYSDRKGGARFCLNIGLFCVFFTEDVIPFSAMKQENPYYPLLRARVEEVMGRCMKQHKDFHHTRFGHTDGRAAVLRV